jgi:hypothetical protein
MFPGKRIYKSLPHEKTPRAGFFHELTSYFLMVTWNGLKNDWVWQFCQPFQDSKFLFLVFLLNAFDL